MNYEELKTLSDAEIKNLAFQVALHRAGTNPTPTYDRWFADFMDSYCNVIDTIAKHQAKS